MDLKDSFVYALRNIRTSHLRSWLTIVGVIIGVISLVVIVSISDGVTKDITDQLEAFGPNMIIIVPVNIEEGGLESIASFGQGASGKLYERDAEAIEGLPGVKSVAKVNYGSTSVAFRDKEISAPIYGTDVSYIDQYSDYMKIGEGRMYQEGERRVVVLGNDAANVYFGKRKVQVGNVLEINGIDYRVIGIFEKIGTSLSQQDDSVIIVPYEDGKDLFSKQLAKGEVNFISVEADEGADIDELKDLIEAKLISYHKVTEDEKDFTVITSEYISETVGGILSMLTAFLILITLVASFVAAIGVANTMFMGVLERTKEIGVLKAVGATENDIMSIFIVESGIIGVAGGAIGIVFSIAILYIAGQFAVPYYFTYTTALFALLFSAGVGIFAGVFPARQAARLDPVDALRG